MLRGTLNLLLPEYPVNKYVFIPNSTREHPAPRHVCYCWFRDFSLAKYKSHEFCIPMANEKTLLKIPQICIVFPVNSTREMNSLLEYSSVNSSLEKFEDTKRVSIRKSKKYRQYNGQKIPKGQSESVNHRSTDNTMAKRYQKGNQNP